MKIRFKYEDIETKDYVIESREFTDAGDLCYQAECDYPGLSTDYGIVSYLEMNGEEIKEAEGCLGKKVVGTLFEAGIPIDTRLSQYTHKGKRLGDGLEEKAVEYIKKYGWYDFTKAVHNSRCFWYRDKNNKGETNMNESNYNDLPKITIEEDEYDVNDQGNLKIYKDVMIDKGVSRLRSNDCIEIYFPEDNGNKYQIYKVYKETNLAYYLEWVDEGSRLNESRKKSVSKYITEKQDAHNIKRTPDEILQDLSVAWYDFTFYLAELGDVMGKNYRGQRVIENVDRFTDEIYDEVYKNESLSEAKKGKKGDGDDDDDNNNKGRLNKDNYNPDFGEGPDDDSWRDDLDDDGKEKKKKKKPEEKKSSNVSNYEGTLGYVLKEYFENQVLNSCKTKEDLINVITSKEFTDKLNPSGQNYLNRTLSDFEHLPQYNGYNATKNYIETYMRLMYIWQAGSGNRAPGQWQ